MMNITKTTTTKAIFEIGLKQKKKKRTSEVRFFIESSVYYALAFGFE
jgi:hypothetical protein